MPGDDDSQSCYQPNVFSSVLRWLRMTVELVHQKSSDTMTRPTRGRDYSTQAIDGQYATVYSVNHCKLTPTSPAPWLTEFPPQRADVSPGRDNFQVGGKGSGETGPLPNKTSSYRGGLTWSSRDAVYTPRVSHKADPFASSLRKYPPCDEYISSFEHFPEVCDKVKLPSTRHPRSTPNSPPKHSKIPNKEHDLMYYMECCCDDDEPEYPTRDQPVDSSRGKTYTKHDNSAFSEPRRHWNKPENISTYTHTHITAAGTEGYDVASHGWNSALQGSTEERAHKPMSPSEQRIFPVSTPVQAVPQKTSREIETVPLPIPTRRTIAIPPSPVASLPALSIHVSPITRSVQTLKLSGISVETTTSSIEIAKHEFANSLVIAKKSKSFSDFKLEHEFKSKLLEWLDDTDDPKVKEFQAMVLNNLTRKLKNTRVTETETIKVKMADCVKSRIKLMSNGEAIDEVIEKKKPHNKCHIFRSEINSRLRTDQSYFEDVIKEWLSNISIRNHDILLRPVRKDLIYNTLVNRLKHLVVKQSKHCTEQLLREEIMHILEQVPIDVDSQDKTNYLELVAKDLIYRLEHAFGHEIKSYQFDKSEKLNIYLPQNNLQPAQNQKMECVLEKTVDVLKRQSVVSSELVQKLKMYLKGVLMDPACSNGFLHPEEVTNIVDDTVGFPENELVQCDIRLTDNWRDIINKRHTNPAVLQFSVWMLQQLSGNGITKPSDAVMYPHSSLSKINKDIEVNLSQYQMQLVKQIEQWLSDLKILQTLEKDFRQAAVLDLVNDIVDRQKYLEFKETRDSYADELEHLKFTIFKWTKRLIGEENMDTVNHAEELMEMIKSIPVPIPTDGTHHPDFNKDLSESNNKFSSTKINSSIFRRKGRNRSVCANYVVHKISTRKVNNQNKAANRRDQAPLSPHKSKVTDNQSGTRNNRSDSSKHVEKNTKNKSQRSKLQIRDDNVDNAKHNNNTPGSSGLVTPTPVSTNQGSSATSKLMAEWRPPPIYTPLPPGKPRLEDVHDEFQEYLQKWSKQIPIRATNPEEEKTADQARLGILKGIWKMITKLKTQPAVFQNKFYYEDILGKEIDELLDCLPQTPELKEKRYTLKAQLIEKTATMNEMVQDLEMPDNWKEILARALLEKQNERIRKVVKLNNEDPTKMFEQMFLYCILDDFLLQSNYKENDKIKDKAYKIKLVEKIQAYVDELKATHGKELEDLFGVVNENDVIKLLYDVPLPSDDSVKENADEILLGLEIEQWMMDLPIVNNDDSREQRHRRRLRDALTKNLLEMDKSRNVHGETQVRHEISVFLEKIPLEENQDLKINDMVDDLTARLKKRQGTSGRRKSASFRNGQHNQTDEWDLEGENARYSNFFKNGVLCSTRIEPQDEWAMEEGQDAQYRALFKERPACSSMIDTQGAYGIEEAPGLPDFRQTNGHEPVFAYIPGQFHESARGGSFRYPQCGSVPCTQYPEPSMMSRYDPSRMFYNSQRNSMADYPLPSQLNNQYQSMHRADTRQSMPPMTHHGSFIPPQGLDFEDPASGGFVSMMEHGYRSPQSPMGRPEPHFSNAHRSGIDVMPPDFPPVAFHAPARNERSLIEPHPQPHASFYPNASVFSTGPSNQSRWNGVQIDPNMQPQMMQQIVSDQPRNFEDPGENARDFVSMREHSRQSPLRRVPEQLTTSRRSNQSRRNSAEIDPNVHREPLEVSVHEAPRSPAVRLNASSSNRNASMLHPDPGTEGGFVSMRSHQLSGGAQAPPATLETSTRNQSIRQSNRFADPQLEPILETDPEPSREIPRPGSGGSNQSRNANRSAHNTSQASRRSIRNVSIREPAPTTHGPASRSPAVPAQGNARGVRGSNVPTEISNHPVGFSTPNQRPDNEVPPDIRRQRQMEKERVSARRMFSDNEDVEDRCHCVERFRRWHSRNAPNCVTCDECVHGGTRNPHFFSYPYPFPYPYPYPPPYPPYCKR